MRAAVLAGGRASRFDGRPKGLERVAGARILDRVVDAVRRALGVPPILIANDADAARWRPDLQVVPDALPACGALGGVYTALTAGDGATLVVAWDLPFVSPKLLEVLAAGAAGYDAFVPESGGPRVEPLCAVYGPGCREPIRAQLEQGDFRATAFHRHVNVGVLPLERVREIGEPGRIFFNVNTPGDLDRAREMEAESSGRNRRSDAQTLSGGQ